MNEDHSFVDAEVNDDSSESKIKMIEEKNGVKKWIKKGDYWSKDWIHRDDDEPAEIWPDGTQIWYKDNKVHREGDKPAKIFSDGSLEWYKNGMRHRDGYQPAIIYPQGKIMEYWEWGHRTGSTTLITNVKSARSRI